jgi:hypothetical protein
METKWTLIRQADDGLEEFESDTSVGVLQITFWSDDAFVTIWRVNAGERVELAEEQVLTSVRLAEALLDVGLSRDEATVCAKALWPLTRRAVLAERRAQRRRRRRFRAR